MKTKFKNKIIAVIIILFLLVTFAVLRRVLCLYSGSAKSLCYVDLAVWRKDLSYCDKIQDSGDKAGCYTHVAMSKGDASICEQLKGEGKQNCYYNVAISLGDSMLCENADYYDGCIQEIAKNKKDSSLCNKIKETVKKDYCHYLIAVLKQDITICEDVNDARLRAICKSYKKTGEPVEDCNLLRIKGEGGCFYYTPVGYLAIGDVGVSCGEEVELCGGMLTCVCD